MQLWSRAQPHTHPQVEIPPAPLSGATLGTGAFAVAWNAFVLTWTLGALAGGGVLFALFSLPFWVAGVGLARSALAGALLKERVQVGVGRWGIQQELAVLKEGALTWTGLGAKALEGKTQDLSQCRVHVAGYVNGVPQTVLQLKEGARGGQVDGAHHHVVTHKTFTKNSRSTDLPRRCQHAYVW